MSDGVPRAESNSATSLRADQELPKKNFCRSGVGKLSFACSWGSHCQTPRVCSLSELIKEKCNISRIGRATERD